MSESATRPFRLGLLFQSGHLQLLGTPMLTGSVALLICGVLLLGMNVSALRQSFAWVQRSDDILIAVSDIKTHVVGNELTVRGYALTDDPIFLRYQKSELHALAENMGKLSRLMADDPTQQSRFVQLKAVVGRHTALFTHLTALGPGRATDVAYAIIDKDNRTVMNNARAALDKLRAIELAILARRQQTTELEVSRTYAMTVGIVVLAFGLGVIGIALLRYGRTA
jgi:CHASE3 domain sensor protein